MNPSWVDSNKLNHPIDQYMKLPTLIGEKIMLIKSYSNMEMFKDKIRNKIKDRKSPYTLYNVSGRGCPIAEILEIDHAIEIAHAYSIMICQPIECRDNNMRLLFTAKPATMTLHCFEQQD